MDLGGGGRGAPVFAVDGGVVERVISNDDPGRAFEGYGNGVIINHGNGTWALYAHLDRATVTAGRPVRAGEVVGRMGNSSNNKFPGMGVHLHLELRRAKRDGSSPYPGPYRTYNLDPRPWLASKGVRFGGRGGIEVEPGSPADVTRGLWSSVAGLGLPAVYIPRTGLRGLGEEYVNEYEPPASFDRDPTFGLTPTQWAIAGVGAVVVTTGIAAVAIRAGMRKNRRQGARASRLAAWGSQ
jgi:hypothetical protein